jgi:hypothetical protein
MISEPRVSDRKGDVAERPLCVFIVTFRESPAESHLPDWRDRQKTIQPS